MPETQFELQDGQEHIELCDLLKWTGAAESGAAAKHLIAEGEVRVDGETETRKRRKVRAGQAVEWGDQRIVVVAK